MSFREFAKSTTEQMGSPKTFIACFIALTVLPIVGVFLKLPHESEFYIHYSLEAITLLLALLIQNSENRHSKASQLKLDELIRAVEGAKTHWVGIEEQSEEKLEEHKHELVQEIQEIEK